MGNIKNNYIYNTVNQILGILTPIITTPYLSRILGAESIGRFSYSNAVAYYFTIFVMLGLNSYGNRTIAKIRENEEELNKAFINIYTMQFILGLVMTVLYACFCYLTSCDMIGWLMIISIIAAMLDVNWFFWGLEEFKLTASRSIFIKIFSVLCIMIFVNDSKDLILYTLIMMLSTFISSIILWVYIIKKINLVRPSYAEVVKNIKPNIVLFVPVIAVSIYKYMDKIMLGNWSSLSEVGYYDYSEKVIQIPLALINSLSTVMLPKMSNLISKKQTAKEKKYISNSMLLVMFLSTSMCFGVMGIAREFVPLFYGQDFMNCVLLFYILQPSCCFVAFASVIRTQFLVPREKDDIFIKSILLGAVINFLINMCLIRRMGSVGAAIGTLAAECVVCVYQSLKVYQEIEIKNYVIDSIPFFVAGLAMFGGLYIFNLARIPLIAAMLLKVFVGIFIYFSVLYVLSVAFFKNTYRKIQLVLRLNKNSKSDEFSR